ncbi:MAG: Crp/Fnr family transcriptional regulator [Bacteroidales bacterium]|nr:Crp/Fnr family transcriptional regulator [Bacteroidales bacterium]MCF6342318.1 Crp/Fnr family transcriptional regulator [Bacteroidales bacterium]
MDCRDCSNKKCYINANCLSSWLEFVQEFKTRKQLSAGSKVFSAGDLVTGIYVICSGKFKITMKNDKAEESIIRLAGDGQVLGHRGISEEMVYPISAESLVSSELAFIPHEVFFKLLRHNVDLSYFMMMFFADELMRTEQKFRLHILKSDKEKVAASLCMVLDAFGFVGGHENIIDSPLKLSGLANFSETSETELTKVLKYLSDAKIIDWGKNKIAALNEPALRALAG